MKLVLKEMDIKGDNYLMYVTTDDNVHVKCDIITGDEIRETLKTLVRTYGKMLLEILDYDLYIKQDERRNC